jgi:hypothetical protein
MKVQVNIQDEDIKKIVLTYLEERLCISEKVADYLLMEMQSKSEKFLEYTIQLQHEEVFAKSLANVITYIKEESND